VKIALKTATIAILACCLIAILGIILMANRPGDASASCQEFYAGMEDPPDAALDWCKAGDYFSWESSLPQNAGLGPLNIFHICQGNPDDPAVLMIHGYPTSSFDYAALSGELSQDHYVCALDTPGYGFSDKPKDGYQYSIFDDARLVDEYVRNIAGLEEFTLVTHDKGDSVGLALLQIYQAYEDKPYTINHHFITNGNIYLPLAQLTSLQNALLHPTFGPLVSSIVGSNMWARSLAESTFATALPQSEIGAYASIMEYQDGANIQHVLIQYLNERKVNELSWLDTLGKSDIPTTLVWGELDAIAPVDVPDEVWASYLENRETPASYWRIPCADHYLQVDEPELIVDIVRATLADILVPSEIERAHCQALKIH
jgi:pimeloyl-ACP methyl ester carboxylesterase